MEGVSHRVLWVGLHVRSFPVGDGKGREANVEPVQLIQARHDRDPEQGNRSVDARRRSDLGYILTIEATVFTGR